jgi:predicted O-linked N-acetylglucosamine transferase (SPINDLY family)
MMRMVIAPMVNNAEGSRNKVSAGIMRWRGREIMDKNWGALAAEVAKGKDMPLSHLPSDDFAAGLHAAVADGRWHIEVINDLGNHLFREGIYAHAAACYGLVAEDARAFGAQANLGRCEIRLGQAATAEARARALLDQYPELLPAWQLLTDALVAQERLSEALEASRRAVELSPGQVMLAHQWAMLAERVQDHEAAAQAFAHVWAIDQSDLRSLRMLVFYRRSICQWQDLGRLSHQLLETIDRFPEDIAPFEFLSEPATAAQQFAYAGRLAEWIENRALLKPIAIKDTRPNGACLRVGFLSHGFGPHPTTLLTSALFDQLRNSRLEIHLFSTRQNVAEHPACRRMTAAVHAFHDVSDKPQREIAEYIQAQDIEILLDLDGYCRGRKPEVFAYHPAPLQVSWLAYPGTTGARFMDYVIADRFVLPTSMQSHFSEKVAYLPRCYQSTDPGRQISIPPSRKACGLPARGVVYACFNASYKFNPRSIWRMLQVLKEVPGSVLWLLRGEGRSSARLQQAAQMKGVAPSRLVFMSKLPHRAYLARYRHVDLFLDTENYNAHTTASDALWAGCPVLTRPGETFASRVAGSLNHHLDMPEMNAVDDAAFVMKAVRFGRDAGYRAAVKVKLLKQRVGSGLFDIEGFARDFEGLLWRMAEHRRAGKLPGTFES